MMTLFRTYRRLVLPALLLAAGTASAQVIMPSYPLPADPGRAVYAPTAAQRVYQRNTVALALPFFDDFTSPLEGTPKVQNWLPNGGAFVSNRLALQPLSRGTATLDGLKANGKSYSGIVTSQYGVIDSLISQPINLGGLTANDAVYLSFAWQAGSIVSAPNSHIASRQPVRLQLMAMSDVGNWEEIWVYNSLAQRTPFRQQVVALNQAKYLHGNFQFMFVASGNRSDNSDNWSVDYVVLDRGRTAALADTTFSDVAISAGLLGGNPSGGLRSPLRRFTAMPVWQFNTASPANSELNHFLGVNVYNLSPGPLPIPVAAQGTVRVQPNGAALGNWYQGTYNALASTRLGSIIGAADSQPVPTTATAKTLRYSLTLSGVQQTDPRTFANDTIFRDVELNNYYAYDDGTYENVINMVRYSIGSPPALAYRFDLNQPDYVRSLRIYPVFTASDAASRSVTVSVWPNAAGRPGTTPIASKTVIIPNPLPTGWQYFEATFDQPVPVTGSFFVGFSQPAQGRDLHYGFDLNSSFPAGYFWGRDNTGTWDSIRYNPRRGALMMRPVMTNNVATATASARDAAAYSLYPNPAHGTVAVAGLGFARATVLDALGRTVWEQPAAQAGSPTLDLPTLPAGVYTVRLTLADGRVVGRRLMLE